MHDEVNKILYTLKNMQVQDANIDETTEWLESLQSLLANNDQQRVHFVIQQLITLARNQNINLPFDFATNYVNTIGTHDEPLYPGNINIEQKIISYLRWNSMAMVLRAGRVAPDVGGHIASYAASAVLYEVGLNHFFRAPNAEDEGDLLYFQGHSSPGIYARSFLEGRLSAQNLNKFRQEVYGKGLSSYPHPLLMPDYWQFSTVSMGLGPIQAIYQAKFLQYLHNRGLANTQKRKIWCFCGDGEMDEPESTGALSLASRENLNNLIFVIKCNLQRLDGPVRGNSKIIQELESIFLGAGWQVIKVIWSSKWDSLLSKDHTGLLRQRMMEVIDGDYQAYKSRGGAYVREHFFGKYPELKTMVQDLSDDDLSNLDWGGQDIKKVYAAYDKAVKSQYKPTVILAKIVKGYGMGHGFGEGSNIAHQKKKINIDGLKLFAQRFDLPLSEQDLIDLNYLSFAEDSPEYSYLQQQRKKLGGYLPSRRKESSVQLSIPELSVLDKSLRGFGDRKFSTTMAFVRILSTLLKYKELAPYIVPIVPDEARTFGMEGLFRQIGIYSSKGQLYDPEDRQQIMYYREDKKGQLLQEGLNESGSFASWLSAATSYSTSNVPLVPMYICYSMFCLQRIMDLAWAAGDMAARGFFLGATSGRTTLAGEGLQHQDGHSHILANCIPNCISYDPTFSYELAVIMHHGLKHMYIDKANVYYYITVMNENYVHADMPQQKDIEKDIVSGLYLFSAANSQCKNGQINLLSCGAIFQQSLKAKVILEKDFGIGVNLWSATSFNQLVREGQSIDHWNMLHPLQKSKTAWVTNKLNSVKNANNFLAVTDYIRAYAEQIRSYIPGYYTVLGTDGFGRSDTRDNLRSFFMVDAKSIVVAALHNLANTNSIDKKLVADTINKFGLDIDKQFSLYSF